MDCVSICTGDQRTNTCVQMSASIPGYYFCRRKSRRVTFGRQKVTGIAPPSCRSSIGNRYPRTKAADTRAARKRSRGRFYLRRRSAVVRREAKDFTCGLCRSRPFYRDALDHRFYRDTRSRGSTEHRPSRRLFSQALNLFP